eukprot:GHVS01064653.1.p1 GENE.GHVS01064653.1~~GHVS01064653.1.p1  ORF type:complete len:505 (-),score=32.62 GHVS01064653.1:44-1558(-)
MCLGKTSSSDEVCVRMMNSYRDYYNNLLAFWAARDDFKSIRNAVLIGLQLLDYNRKCCNNMFYGKRCSVARLSNLCRSDASINEDSSVTLHRGHLASIELVMSAELGEVLFRLLSQTSDNGLLFPSNKNSLRPMSPKEWRADLHRAERASGVRKPAKDEEKGDYMQQEKETGANRFRFSPNQVSDAYTALPTSLQQQEEEGNLASTRFKLKKEKLLFSLFATRTVEKTTVSLLFEFCQRYCLKGAIVWTEGFPFFVEGRDKALPEFITFLPKADDLRFFSYEYLKIPLWNSPISRKTSFSHLSDYCQKHCLKGIIIWRIGYPCFVPAWSKKKLRRRKRKRLEPPPSPRRFTPKERMRRKRRITPLSRLLPVIRTSKPRMPKLNFENRMGRYSGFTSKEAFYHAMWKRPSDRRLRSRVQFTCGHAQEARSKKIEFPTALRRLPGPQRTKPTVKAKAGQCKIAGRLPNSQAGCSKDVPLAKKNGPVSRKKNRKVQVLFGTQGSSFL